MVSSIRGLQSTARKGKDMSDLTFNMDDLEPLPADALGLAKESAGVSLSYWQNIWRCFKKNKLSVMSLIFIVFLIFVAVFGPMLTRQSYSDQNRDYIHIPPQLDIYAIGRDTYVYLSPSMQLLKVSKDGHLLGPVEKLEDDLSSKRRVYTMGGQNIIVDYRQKPARILYEDGKDVPLFRKKVWNKTFWFGTDSVGRDLFVRIIYGARVTMIIGFVASFVNLTIGVLYGGIAGYLGGMTDNIMMRIVDILRSIPRLLYVILLMVVFGSGLLTVVIVIGLVDWLGMARIVRGQVFSIKNREYVLAARALGAKPKRILLRHLIPNALGPIIIETAMNIPHAIFTEAFLSFVGLGVSAPQASWGTLANNALSGFMSYPYEMFFPAIAISLTVLAFNFLGDGLRDAIDPRFKE